MTNDRPKERRRVAFRTTPTPTPDESTDAADTSYMMLGDADVERIVAERTTHESNAPAEHHSGGLLQKISARELAGIADKSIHKATAFGERAVRGAAGIAAPAAAAAKRVGRLPSLASLSGFGGRRAPVDRNDENDESSDPPYSPGGASHGLPRRRRADITSRVVHINDDAKNVHFPTNYVSTTKYSLWSALPLFLYEQFTRFSNAYFLFVGIGYTIDAISPIFTIGRYSTLWVLAVVVFISGVKEGIEDYHRYREDRRVNRATTHILGSNTQQDQWESVRVGHIIKVFHKEHLPADIVLVGSSSDDGLAYIETKQLDGESNLKVKVVPRSISAAFKTDSSSLLVKGRVECETPNDRLYKFSGRMIIEKAPGASQRLDDDSDESSEAAQVPLGEAVALGPENFLIRGSSIRNTEWILGYVINTGLDTKLMQNVKPRPRKNSRLERETNRHYFLTLALQICVVVALTIRSRQACNDLFGNGRFAWYLLARDGCDPVDAVLRLFTFFITFSALIPISLYVSMEIVRGFQVYFIEHDKTIVDPETKVKTEVRTSNLNEELGVIHHVFTDKTGTLTANRMEFKKCSIGGRVYETADMPSAGATNMSQLREALQAGPESSAVREFSVPELDSADTSFRLLALCHSVVAEAGAAVDEMSENGTEISSGSSNTRARRLRRRRHRETDEYTDRSETGGRKPEQSDKSIASGKTRQSSSLNSGSRPGTNAQSDNQRISSSLNESAADSGSINYQASSPDEAALVQAARGQGYTYLSRSNRDTVIDVFGRPECHELLEIIEFDSSRKRMSVITKDPEGRIRIYTKGADAVIFTRLAPGQSYDLTEQHLHEFAVEGLRTLCLAYAEIDPFWFESWHRRYKIASSELDNREAAVAVVVDEVERNLVLLGATAIEDKLQEGVPETLRKLDQAGVKVWVLTGDKQETAINIGLSCGAIDEGMDVVIINENNLEDTGAQIDRALGRWSAMLTDISTERKMGLVIDGETLHYALAPELQKKLIFVTRMARSVIACRVTPKQKTEIVELVRRHDKDQVTLAIGDGANDVGMIQAAHVGVGIVGLEGQEAKLASDYSIGQFRFLARLMLVHGRWSYKRLSKMVLFTIYKNATLTLCEIYWATFSAFSGQPLLDPWMGGLYNLFLTSLPPIVLGIFDQELSPEYALAFPEIYAKGQRNTAYSFRVFSSWLVSAFWQSAVIYFVCYWGFGDGPSRNGQTLGMWPFGSVVFSAVIFNVHAILLVYQSSWNKLTAGLYVVSLLSWFLLGTAISWRPIALGGRLSPNLYAVMHRVFGDARFWFVIALCPVLTTSPSLLYKYSKRRRRPNMKMLVQELLRSGKTREDLTGEPKRPLHRVPSYDPKRPTTPSGPVTFVVKGEREYQFSGFNFDAGESGAVLRHTFHTTRGIRRRRMRVLKRAGSDTELDVEGVQTHAVESADQMDNMTGEWVRGHATKARGVPYMDLQNPREAPGAALYDVEEDSVAFQASAFRGAAGSGAVQGGSHRRAVSDGAVLVEGRFQMLGQQEEKSRAGNSSSEGE